MASSRKRYSDEEWLQHRAEIQRMFLNESASFNEIMRNLEEDGFPVTKSQLEYKLRVWGLRRRIPKNKTEILWQYIGHRLDKRESQGKLSEVIYEGKVIVPAKVKKERSRYQTTSLVKYHQGPISPQTPAEFNILICTPERQPASPRTSAESNLPVCTPSPLPVRSSWPECLPWLRFQTEFSALFQVRKAYMESKPESSHSRDLQAIYASQLFNMTSINTSSDVALLSARLGSMMPETAEGSNTRLAQALLETPSQMTMHEHHRLLIYQISNDMDGSLSSDHWVRIVDVLESSGILSLQLSIGGQTGPTLNGFFEKLFQHTFIVLGHLTFTHDRAETLYQIQRAERLVLWMLSSGQTPNIPIKPSYLRETSTALQLAVMMNQPHLANQLMDAGATIPLSDGFSTIIYAVYKFQRFRASGPETDLNPEMVEVLQRFIEAGVSLDEGTSSLIGAIHLGSLPLAKSLILAGANVSYALPMPSWGWGPREIGVIGYAADIKKQAKALEFIMLLLEHARSMEPWRTQSDFITADVVMQATANGHVSILEYLHGLGYNIPAAECKGVTALHVAAAKGLQNVCRRLLRYGSLVDGLYSSKRVPSPMMLAALEGHEDAVRLLHRHGARIDSSFALNSADDSMYVWPLVQCRSHHAWSHNISRLGDAFITPAGAAILGSHWNNATYNYLIECGASVPEWAIYHGACDARQFGLVKVALENNANVNWASRTEETPLQAMLSSARRRLWGMKVEHTSEDDTENFRAECASLCFNLLDAGALSKGGEAQMAVFLNNWKLVEHILGICSYRRHTEMTLLEAAFLSGLETMVHQVFEREPAAYDDGALCAAVLFASEHRNTAFLQKLLKNRHKSVSPSPLGGTAMKSRYKSVSPSPLEGTAMGLAAWSADTEVLKMLYVEFGTPLAAVCPVDVFKQASSDDSIEQAILNWNIGMRKLPFWHDENLELVEPLFFILQSKKWAPKLQELKYCSERHSMIIDIDPNSDGMLKVQLSRKQDENIDLLYLAVKFRDYDGVKALLDAGEDVNMPYDTDTSRTRSSLQQAVEDGSLEILEVLLEAGADVNAPAARRRGATALQLAAITGRLGIAKMLIDLGANVNAPRAEEDGRTALEGAAERGKIDMIQYLLYEGAETRGRGRLQYMRAIKFAEREGHLVAANLLREYRNWTTADDDMWGSVNRHQDDWEGP
ncbi:hypothetical protein CSIM01_03414 [Colletotrichum simmondsii]|uniref:Clr5 domain-containing protein n=1 Tax=Colletotrichum simmondsii TaxID=703756 RepID=A0A135SZ63_9PEZI|nr:hypothetical protein CSIM01_03414 [Colletotrichum simmondsii]